jgi:hypothetical protein
MLALAAARQRGGRSERPDKGAGRGRAREDKEKKWGEKEGKVSLRVELKSLLGAQAKQPLVRKLSRVVAEEDRRRNAPSDRRSLPTNHHHRH